VDEKKITENVVLGFFIKRRFSSSLNLLGQRKAAPPKGILKGKAQRNEPG